MSIVIYLRADLGRARVRASAPDPYAGLRGHDYIAARQLQKKATRFPKPAVDLPPMFRKPSNSEETC